MTWYSNEYTNKERISSRAEIMFGEQSRCIHILTVVIRGCWIYSVILLRDRFSTSTTLQ